MNANQYIPMRRFARLPIILLAVQIATSLCPPAGAFPPAPYHLIYGMVRDQYGTPLTSEQAQIVLQPLAGAQTSTTVLPGMNAGINYQINVPMDAGNTPELYLPNALFAGASFKLVVVIGGVTHTPIEMAGRYVILGQPGKTTRVDLTLGVDANNDGLPDAWEAAFLASIGATNSLSSLTANLVLGGRSLREHYLVGSLFDPENPLLIAAQGLSTTNAVLQFPTITGRYYTVEGSFDFITWIPMPFTLATDAPGSPSRTNFYASSITTVQAFLEPPPPGARQQFYRVSVQ